MPAGIPITHAVLYRTFILKSDDTLQKHPFLLKRFTKIYITKKNSLILHLPPKSKNKYIHLYISVCIFEEILCVRWGVKRMCVKVYTKIKLFILKVLKTPQNPKISILPLFILPIIYIQTLRGSSLYVCRYVVYMLEHHI